MATFLTFRATLDRILAELGHAASSVAEARHAWLNHSLNPDRAVLVLIGRRPTPYEPPRRDQEPDGNPSLCGVR